MKITENAKAIIDEVLKANNFTAVAMKTLDGGCSKTLSFDLVNPNEGETPLDIDGVLVFMDAETDEWTKDVILDGANGQLQLVNPNSACSGCGGGCH